MRIPRHFAGASLKQQSAAVVYGKTAGIPRHFAGASLKLAQRPFRRRVVCGIPRHFAGASLKQGGCQRRSGRQRWYSPAFRWGLIEAYDQLGRARRVMQYSPAFRWGLIEARIAARDPSAASLRIPRHFAGASLKLRRRRRIRLAGACIPRHFAGASLKRQSACSPRLRIHVFPGISLGPH